MIEYRMITSAWIALCGLACAGCDGRREAGPASAETRAVGSFDSIEMEGAARLEITVGATHSVVLEGRAAVIRRVDIDVRGDTLHIESKPRDWFAGSGRPRITVKIGVPHLKSLRLEGGNDVRLHGFDGGAARLKMAGATHIQASGHLDELTVHMAGAGHADLSQLTADETKVTLDGVGSVIVHPRQTLDATMNGVGAILYTGSPREVNTRMNGLGTIGRREHNDGSKAEPEQMPLDPDTLQPEYEDRPAPARSGEVI